jgi:AraC family transcriptional regulator
MKKHPHQVYDIGFNRVLDFIDRHLDEPLSVGRLGRVAHFSTFHFHRQFTHYVGITPARYIQLARLRRASYRLAFNSLARITDIALEAGFEHSKSFSRAFKATFGQSPSAFRGDPDWSAWSAQFKFTSSREIDAMQVKIVTLEPVTVPAKQFRFDICGSVSKTVPANRHGIVTKTIPRGRCAVVRHEGSVDQIAGSVYHLYRNWLPHSGEELRGYPIFFHYLNLKINTPEHELLTDVHLPLK